jgi:hypothetical protein
VKYQISYPGIPDNSKEKTKMDSAKLAAAVRDIKLEMGAMSVRLQDEDDFPGSDAETALHDATGLLSVLALIVAGTPIDRAFGSPGDWGYNTAIGKALAGRG